MNDENNLTLNAQLHAKILAISSGVGVIPKNGINKHFKYKYVKDSDIINGLRGLMAQHGVMVTPEIIDVVASGNDTLITMVFHVTDTTTGHSVPHKWFGESNDKQDKGVSQSITSAQKYFLKTLFMISTENPADDPDSNGDNRKPHNNPQLTQNSVQHAQNNDDPPFATSTDWKHFWMWTKAQGLTKVDVHRALNVESAKDYTGTKSQATFLLQTVIDRINKGKEF